MKTTSSLIAAAVAGIALGAAACEKSQAQTTAPDHVDAAKHGCKGQNACKGQGGCKTDKHGCKGQNACKGQGGCGM